MRPRGNGRRRALGEHGIQRYWKSGFVPELSDDFIELVVERAQTIPSPMTLIPMFYTHGHLSQVDPQATAFGLRGNQWDFDIISQWTNPAEQSVHVQWTREFWKEVVPYTRRLRQPQGRGRARASNCSLWTEL